MQGVFLALTGDNGSVRKSCVHWQWLQRKWYPGELVSEVWKGDCGVRSIELAQQRPCQAVGGNGVCQPHHAFQVPCTESPQRQGCVHTELLLGRAHPKALHPSQAWTEHRFRCRWMFSPCLRPGPIRPHMRGPGGHLPCARLLAHPCGLSPGGPCLSFL